MHKLPSTIAAELRAYLKRARLTQQMLEKRSGIAQPQISRICRGQFERITPTVVKLCRIANISLTGQRRGPSRQLSALINGIVAGSRHRERLVVKLLKTAASLTLPTPKRKQRFG